MKINIKKFIFDNSKSYFENLLYLIAHHENTIVLLQDHINKQDEFIEQLTRLI